MTSTEATFNAVQKLNSARWLLHMASVEELDPDFKIALGRLACDVSTTGSVVETVAHAMRDTQPAQA